MRTLLIDCVVIRFFTSWMLHFVGAGQGLKDISSKCHLVLDELSLRQMFLDEMVLDETSPLRVSL